MSWGDVKGIADEAGGGGKYLSISDGDDAVVGIFCGEPIGKRLFFDATEKKFVPYTDAHKQRGDKMSRNFSINFLQLMGAEPPEMRIFKGPLAFIIALREVYDLYGKPTNRMDEGGEPIKSLAHRVFRVTRTGEKASTRFGMLPLDDVNIPDYKTWPPMHDLEDDESAPAGEVAGSRDYNPAPSSDQGVYVCLNCRGNNTHVKPTSKGDLGIWCLEDKCRQSYGGWQYSLTGAEQYNLSPGGAGSMPTDDLPFNREW